MLFTTSWDDGYTLDLKVGEMLKAHGATGTFYICPVQQHGQRMMSETQIRELGATHEIGAHSLTHRWLTHVSAEEKHREIAGSKAWVEQITGKPCAMFCYPFGDHDDDVTEEVQDAGFAGARTVEDLQFSSSNRFTIPTSLQISHFPWRRRWSRWWHPFDPLGPLRARWSRLRALGVPLSACGSWLSLATHLFHWSLDTNQPFFHLWGHSAEIEKYGMWEDLEVFLRIVHDAGDNIQHVTNCEIVNAPKKQIPKK